MSTWVNLEEPSDMEIDGEEINVFLPPPYTTDEWGAAYLTIPVEWVKELLKQTS